MFEQIVMIVFVVSAIAYGLYKFIRRKDKKSKIEGVERLSRETERLEHEKIKEQKRNVDERSDILFMEFHTIFCVKLGFQAEDKESVYYRHLILNRVREQTDRMMKDVIYVNNIAGREGRAWKAYKKQKADYILKEVIDYISDIYRDDLIGVSHEDAIVNCRDDIVKVYYEQIEEIFEEIKNISEEYNKKIVHQEKLLYDLKNGKKR